MVMQLQPGAVYGPMQSRRLGKSLGINILPCTMKFCLSDCIYCQYGHTDLSHLNLAELPRADELLEEIKLEFESRSLRGDVYDAVTFSGNGEPTLHPEFHKIVRGTKALRNRYFPDVPLAILSDSSQVLRPGVQHALMEFDRRYMKLDAGDAAVYEAMNRTMVSRNLDHIIESLATLRPLFLQSLFIREPVNNAAPEALEKWVRAVEKIQPVGVHIYTVGRDTADPGVKAASEGDLVEVAAKLESQTGISGYVF